MSFAKYAKKGNAKQVVENPTPEQTRRKNKDKDRVKQNRSYIIQEIKKRGGCEFCGVILHHRVYQWHHIWDEDPDKKAISNLCGRSTNQRLDTEFNKCVLLCPTCHSTFNQDLCCMFEHKQQHIDGTYGSSVLEYEEETEIHNSIIKFLS